MKLVIMSFQTCIFFELKDVFKNVSQTDSRADFLVFLSVCRSVEATS